jgi:hypothetical protein
MAYMIYQRYTTAVLDAYAGHPDVGEQLEQARAHRRWLEALEIDVPVKAALVEQARALEAAFARLALRTSSA